MNLTTKTGREAGTQVFKYAAYVNNDGQGPNGLATLGSAARTALLSLAGVSHEEASQKPIEVFWPDGSSSGTVFSTAKSKSSHAGKYARIYPPKNYIEIIKSGFRFEKHNSGRIYVTEAKAQSGTPAVNSTTAKPQVPGWNTPLQPREEVPYYGLTITEEERASYRLQKSKPNKPSPASQETREALGPLSRGESERSVGVNRKPSSEEFHAMFSRQGFQDYRGNKRGSFMRLKNEYTLMEFVIGHIISKKEAGQDQYWNEDGSPNWRVVASKVNDFEQFYKMSPERDKHVGQRIEESGYEFNVEPPFQLMGGWKITRFSAERES